MDGIAVIALYSSENISEEAGFAVKKRLHLFWITHPSLYWQLQQFSSSENTKTGNSAPALTETEGLNRFLQECIIFLEQIVKSFEEK